MKRSSQSSSSLSLLLTLPEPRIQLRSAAHSLALSLVSLRSMILRPDSPAKPSNTSLGPRAARALPTSVQSRSRSDSSAALPTPPRSSPFRLACFAETGADRIDHASDDSTIHDDRQLQADWTGLTGDWG